MLSHKLRGVISAQVVWDSSLLCSYRDWRRNVPQQKWQSFWIISSQRIYFFYFYYFIVFYILGCVAHYTRNCKIIRYPPYTLQLFSHLQQFFSTFSYEQRFPHQLLKKSLQFCVCCVRALTQYLGYFNWLLKNTSN